MTDAGTAARPPEPRDAAIALLGRMLVAGDYEAADVVRGAVEWKDCERLVDVLIAACRDAKSDG